MKLACLVTTVAFLLVFLLHMPFPRDQLLQHGPTALGLVALGVALRRDWLTTTSFALLCAFLCLHILGARYLYSNVPYDAWFESLVGSGPSAWFEWERNHYDRLVHLLFGVLLVTPAAEVGARYGRMSRGWALAFAVCALGAISMLYEVVEWSLTMLVSPESAESYNGQQGDMWDAQKDMALAFVGSVAALPLAWWHLGKPRDEA